MKKTGDRDLPTASSSSSELLDFGLENFCCCIGSYGIAADFGHTWDYKGPKAFHDFLSFRLHSFYDFLLF